jgi:site-specific recombinase XerD
MNNSPLEYLSASFELHLRAENKAPKTVGIYLASLRHFARWAERRHPELTEWTDITRVHLREWSVDTIESSSAGNASVHWRGLQQFLKWAELDGEITSNPMRNLSGPQPGPPVVPVLEIEKLQSLLAAVSGNTFVDRRDNAILRLLIDTGIRRGEIVGLCLDDLQLLEREASVTGKGSRQRTVKFGAKTAKAVDRYLRLRSRHANADRPELWLSTRADGPITYHGMAMIIRRRADQAGLDHVHLHQFRHTFAHLWLDQGGAEGDLMELAGWTSRQMLTRYGASARSARARRSYDRVTLGDQF